LGYWAQIKRSDFLKIHSILSTKGKRQQMRGAGVDSRYSFDSKSNIALMNYTILACI
jgi:hypothetical protein